MAAGLLKRGSRGPEVRSLQVQLNTVMSSSAKLNTDGVFGAKTQAAIKEFQTKARIKADGIVGPDTRQKLSEAANRKSLDSSDHLRAGTRGPAVRRLQRMLNLKSPRGPKLVADGMFGQQTMRAVSNFQIHAGVSADGVVGPQTWAALESAPNAPRKVMDQPKQPLPPTDSPVTDMPKSIRPHYSGIVEAYGDPEDWSYLKRVPLPFTLHYGSKPIRSTFVHKKVAQSLVTALSQILGHYGIDQIESLRINHNYGGLVNKRKMRGGSQWSTHSWGVAIDLNHSENKLRWGADRALFAKPEYKPLLDIFERNGWYNLGRHRNYDFMHFQAVMP